VKEYFTSLKNKFDRAHALGKVALCFGTPIAICLVAPLFICAVPVIVVYMSFDFLFGDD
jgi:hypothetical protein